MFLFFTSRKSYRIASQGLHGEALERKLLIEVARLEVPQYGDEQRLTVDLVMHDVVDGDGDVSELGRQQVKALLNQIEQGLLA